MQNCQDFLVDLFLHHRTQNVLGKKLSKGQKCSTVDSDDYIVFPKGCFGCIPDDYVQICKSMSNKFSVHENGKGYCHVGTRQNGRCKLEDDPNRDLYEIKFPGN